TTFVRDKKQFFFVSCLQITAQFFQGVGRAFPAAHSIRWIAPADIDTKRSQNVGIERGQAHQQPEDKRASGAQSPAAARFESLMPEGDREQTETGKSKCVPIRCRSLVD